MIEKRRLENEINSIVSNDALSAKMKIKLLKEKKQELLKKETKSLKVDYNFTNLFQNHFVY